MHVDVYYGDALTGVAHVLKLRIRDNQISGMPRLQFGIRRMYRERGPAGRNLPFAIGDVVSLRGSLDLKATGR